MTDIRPAAVADAAVLSALWSAAGLAHRPAEVARELASVLIRDPGIPVRGGKASRGRCWPPWSWLWWPAAVAG
jgi:hypothetical protein